MDLECWNYGTRHSCIFHISLAYWAIVRSLLNFPLPAVLNIDIFSHNCRSLQNTYVRQILFFTWDGLRSIFNQAAVEQTQKPLSLILIVEGMLSMNLTTIGSRSLQRLEIWRLSQLLIILDMMPHQQSSWSWVYQIIFYGERNSA